MALMCEIEDRRFRVDGQIFTLQELGDQRRPMGGSALFIGDFLSTTHLEFLGKLRLGQTFTVDRGLWGDEKTIRRVV
jgi:hypothetical protein